MCDTSPLEGGGVGQAYRKKLAQSWKLRKLKTRQRLPIGRWPGQISQCKADFKTGRSHVLRWPCNTGQGAGGARQATFEARFDPAESRDNLAAGGTRAGGRGTLAGRLI